jgi:hypothetical protein
MTPGVSPEARLSLNLAFILAVNGESTWRLRIGQTVRFSTAVTPAVSSPLKCQMRAG